MYIFTLLINIIVLFVVMFALLLVRARALPDHVWYIFTVSSIGVGLSFYAVKDWFLPTSLTGAGVVLSLGLAIGCFYQTKKAVKH